MKTTHHIHVLRSDISLKLFTQHLPVLSRELCVGADGHSELVVSNINPTTGNNSESENERSEAPCPISNHFLQPDSNQPGVYKRVSAIFRFEIFFIFLVEFWFHYLLKEKK